MNGPLSDPCAGHSCDGCATCRYGRCCKRDHEGYHLPDEGDWDGPIFGRIGVLNGDGSKIECHVCGEWRPHLGQHVRMHDLSADEYRAIFGLRASTALAVESIRALRRTLSSTEEHVSRMRRLGGVRNWTPEQRAAANERANRRRYSTEQLIDPAWQDAVRRRGAATQARLADPQEKERLRARLPQWQRKRVEVHCAVCGTARLVKPSYAKAFAQHVCSDTACYAELARRRFRRKNGQFVGGDDGQPDVGVEENT